ncbi:hypothetical protein [Methylobacterium nodulans]|uniref:Secreted protein n=1 Tax=Methylobacterium nodulans (strain LMG 21967 / CNCM I-2342 / ORS 2060) TaxID=460265 RepID=B8II34_METNO|nr:hypothetical protein [Methylobacterium nodulans]ACL57903.1 hypothetical protein Mnod_2952 [Methylobacterium nodulans ORS 2060]
MRIIARIIRKLLALLAPTTVSIAASEVPKAATPAQHTPSVSQLVKRLSDQPVLRARFAADPRAVLTEAGIDSASLNLGDRLSDAEIEQLIGRWRTVEISARLAASEEVSQGPTAEPSLDKSRNPAPVDGHPPGMQPSPSVKKPDNAGARQTPPVPVYGPPPGLRRP